MDEHMTSRYDFYTILSERYEVPISKVYDLADTFHLFDDPETLECALDEYARS